MDVPVTLLKDYRPPVYRIETVRLCFDLDPAVTTVRSRLSCRAAGPESNGADFVLQGKDLETVSVTLDGRVLDEGGYRLAPETLTIFAPPAVFTLETMVRIRPEQNTALEGLYVSGGNFFTQCEAEGFRRITWFADRPDVMARYTVRLEADKARFPVLLANGNLTDSGALPGDRHFATFEDPFAKPCYLFAVVAGNLASVEDTFTTRSGREVALGIYVQQHNLDKCGHAMESLKHAMRWDEDTFGLECDLDQYKIVAVDDFNMGAMENKGLNVFNSKFVLARPDTATDDDFDAIEAVVAHEYFHNWTGNRVTCRDWFQLSLKEGLTVFRDQEFSARIISGAVKRIHDVNLLRSVQFPEDSGPMAHPVRPDHYIEINNFYTVTVYEKGAEVVRMLHTLLGAELFRQGLALYLDRHDGSAATTDDFVVAMEEVSGRDLRQFRLWYSQAGTPELRVQSAYDPGPQTFTLTIKQSCPATPGQPNKAAMHIPISLGLLDPRSGAELQLRLSGEDSGKPAPTERVLEVRGEEEHFTFTGIAARPVASLLRDFSAPVRLFHETNDEELGFLARHDPNLFNRWEAAHRLAERTILSMVAGRRAGAPPSEASVYLRTVESLLTDPTISDLTYKAQLLSLPSEDYLAEQMEEVDVDGIHAARESLKKEVANRFEQKWRAIYQDLAPHGPYRYDQVEAGRRRLRNLALGYLAALDGEEALLPAMRQFETADNMTDSMAALRALAHRENSHRRKVLEAFAGRWRDNPLVMDKWFAVQATAPIPTALAEVLALMEHPAFTLLNPNRVRALIGAFCRGNPVAFHAADGGGYRFLADQVLRLNARNPQIAARLCGALSRWRRYDASRRELMRAQLERIRASGELSTDVYEVVAKSLA